MAKDQFLKDKKKTAIILVSLASGMSVFLSFATLIQSQGARTVVQNYMDMDMVLQNDTLEKEDQGKWTDIMDDAFLKQIRENSLLKEVNPLSFAKINIPWDPEVSDPWVRKFYEMWMYQPYDEVRDSYRTGEKEFLFCMLGIDENEFDHLSETLEMDVNKKDFFSGKTCILYQAGLDVSFSDMKKKTLTCTEYGKEANKRTFEIAGLTGENYYDGTSESVMTVLVSDNTLYHFLPDNEIMISKIGIQYRKEFDESAEKQILRLMETSKYQKAFSYESRIEEKERIEKAQGNLMEIGIGIAVILGIISVLNYMNTVTGSIQNRRVELAILESLGMTRKQMWGMLVLEGIFIAGGSLFLTFTIGTGITYLLYQTVNYRGVPFFLPILPVSIMSFLIFGICVSIPPAVQVILERQGSMMERIRKTE